MKSILIATAFLLSSIIGFAQCTPNAPTGNPGVFPPPDSIPCVEKGVPYDFTMQTENFDSFTFTVQGFTVNALVNWTRIDSVENFPCGLTWQSDQTQYVAGETGCIKVSGTSNEPVGQYPLKIYLTMDLTIDFIGNQQFSGELNELIAQLEQYTGPQGYDFRYVSRVINNGGNCPARDTTSDLLASGDVCPTLDVTIDGATSICAGASTTLTATTAFAAGTVTYNWSNGATTETITVNSTGTYSVTVDDGANTATASVNVTTGSAPTTAFTATTNDATVSVNNTTTNATSYAWNYGDGTTSTLQNPAAHTYASNGTFTITLIATNSCGSDTASHDVTITGVFINSVSYDLSFDVFPNPSTGNVSLNFSADNSSSYDLNIYDLSGKNVYAEKITATAGNVQKQLDLTALPKGIYTLRLNSEGGFGVKKLQLN